jgi:hypothetical protein
MQKITTILFALAATTLPLATLADIPPLNESWAELAYEGPETLSLFTVPDGSGKPFTQAYLPSGVLVDGTITLHVVDYNYNPISDFPREDIWLESTDDGLINCIGGSNPDANTDANGITTWTSGLNAGGSSMSLIRVYINGSPLYSSQGLNLHTNSTDINGDLTVNLIDVTLFSQDLFNAYNYRSDFHCDGVINLLDVQKLAESVQADCP